MILYALVYLLIKQAQKQLEYNHVDECNEENLKNVEGKDLVEKYEDYTLKKFGRFNIISVKESIVMVVGKIKVFPVVEAEIPPESPKRPPEMRYEDLPIYESPHSDYKEYIADLQKCPHADVKLLHEFLLPYVKCGRYTFDRSLCEVRCAVGRQRHNFEYEADKWKKEFVTAMRDPDRLLLRQGIVATGVLAGYMIGCRGGFSQRLICTGLGLLSTGALCFPKETEDVFKYFTYHVGKTIVAFYNKLCCQEFVFPERLPCERDMPNLSPNRKYICPIPQQPTK